MAWIFAVPLVDRERLREGWRSRSERRPGSLLRRGGCQLQALDAEDHGSSGLGRSDCQLSKTPSRRTWPVNPVTAAGLSPAALYAGSKGPRICPHGSAGRPHSAADGRAFGEIGGQDRPYMPRQFPGSG